MIANPGEDQLIGLLQSSDETALAFLFQEYHPPLYYFALRILDDRRQAEHVLGRCFVRLWSQRHRFQSMADIELWIYTFISDACHTIKQQQGTTDEDLMQALLVKTKLLQQVYIATYQWPPQQREIFLMIYMDGMSLFQVAEALSITVDTVRVMHAKALSAIRHLRQ
jgi:RNA polymerase sigma factor (sigma-70 family)